MSVKYFGETTTHYKLYKCGKNWVVMGISLFSLGLGMLFTSRPVSADVTATSTSSSAVRTDAISASSNSAAKAETTSSSSSSAAKAETTSSSSSSAAKAETTSSSSSSAAKALATDKEVLTHVTKDNFLAYFSLNGSATYDQNTGIVTITPDEYKKVGNFSLN